MQFCKGLTSSIVLLLLLYVPSQANAAQASVIPDELYDWVESWRMAWEKGDTAEYISFYVNEALQDNRRGREAILFYKRRLWKRAKPVSIHFSSFKIYRHPEGLMLVFAQKYSGEGGFYDSGYKTIVVVPGAAGEKKWLIAEERWYSREPAIPFREIKPPEEKKDTSRTMEEPRPAKQQSTPATETKPAVSPSVSGGETAVTSIKEEQRALPPEPLESRQRLPEKVKEELLSFPVWFDELKLTPSLTISQAYNDNVYFTVANRKGDWISNVSPALELADRTERMNASLTARFDGYYYLDRQDLNTVDPFYRGEFRYEFTNKLALGAEAGYSRDSQANREIYTTGSVFPTPVGRQRYNYGASGEWRPAERLLMIFLYNSQNDHYDNPGYSDLQSHNAGINSEYNLSPITKGRLNFGYARYIVSSATMDNYTGTIGVSRDINNLWSILIDAGAGYSQSRYDVLGLTLTPGGLAWTSRQQTNEEWGPVGRATLAFKHEKTNGSITLSRSVMPFSGLATTVNRTNLSLDLKHKFTYELSGFLTAGYFINKSDQGEFSNILIDEKAIQVVMGSRYDFSKDMFLMASYTYNRIDYGQYGTSADQHLVLLTFNVKHTFKE